MATWHYGACEHCQRRRLVITLQFTFCSTDRGRVLTLCADCLSLVRQLAMNVQAVKS